MGKIIKNGIEYGGAPLPIASSQVVGGVKVGNGLSIAPDGTLSAQGGGGGASSLGQLSDVELETLESGQVLKLGYDEDNDEYFWYNGTLAIPTTLDELEDVSAESPSNGDVLKYNALMNVWVAEPAGGGSAGLSKYYMSGDTYTSPYTSSITLNFNLSTNPNHSGAYLLSFAPSIVLTDGTNEYNLSGKMEFVVDVSVNASNVLTSVYGESGFQFLYGSAPGFKPLLYSAQATAQLSGSAIQITLFLNDACAEMSGTAITSHAIGTMSIDRWDKMYCNAVLIG